MNNLNIKHKNWLINRGISESTIDYFQLSSTKDNKIKIPVKNFLGKVIFNKYRRDPEDETGNKYSYDIGARVALFNVDCFNNTILKEIIICEGELDAMVLNSQGFNAVTSTGGAMSFQKDWANLFTDKNVYVCLDNDKAGRDGTIKICKIIPHAKVVPLPKEVGDHGDITDYFKLGYNRRDFQLLMGVAEPLVFEEKKEVKLVARRAPKDGDRINRAKAVPLESLLKFDCCGKASCPFHTDKTPSLQKYSNNTWYCFSCGAGRDTIDLVMKMQNLLFNEAIDYLLK